MGLAAALLVFTGIWHLAECLMDRAARDARKLIPFGVLYLALGIVIAAGHNGKVVGALAALAVITGMSLALANRTRMDVRAWVLWAFVVIDLAILAAIIASWL